MMYERIGGRIRLKSEEKEDRLSALPDSLIHHILSFLPSTKQAIQTGILSKRWLNQWTFVYNLIFDFPGMFSDYSLYNIPLTTSSISRIIDQTLVLHQCSKIQKFQIITDHFYEYKYDPNFEEKIRLVVRKQVEELILKFSNRRQFRFPEFFFTQHALVKLQLSGCSILHTGIVNWASLKDLSIQNCCCTDEAITSIVSGSPLLQSLEIKCYFLALLHPVIASKSLKRLVVFAVRCYVDILCPNLVELEILLTHNEELGWCGEVLEKILSSSLLLESLKLKNLYFSSIRIASKILKKLVFKGGTVHDIEISCPHLEDLRLSGSLTTIRFVNLPSSACASLDLVYHEGLQETAVKQILESVQHLNELKLGSSFIKTLSALEMAGTLHPLLNCKSLVVKGSRNGPSFERVSGIIFALRCSPMLERLVIKLRRHKYLFLGRLSTLDYSGENYWNSYGARFSSLVSHLRTVEITGFSQGEGNPKLMLDFVQFLLINAKLLEKIVIVLKACGADFRFGVSQKLLSFPRCSAATIELLCS